ncbi:MAG: alpha/beta fold hydrolase [Egibacteraceae bacterium]
MIEPEVRSIDVGGVSLRIRSWNPRGATPSPRFVLVHGLASNALTWEQVASSIASHGYPVTSLDQRGHGRSEKPDGPYDMPTVAADLDGLLSRLGLRDVVLAGQSWGGNVVLEYAYLHPKRLRGVICVDGGTIDLQARWPQWEDCKAVLAPPRLEGTPVADWERMLREAYPAWDDSGIAATMANMEMLPDGTVRPWLPFDRHLQVLRGLWEHRPAERYDGLSVPVMLVPVLIPDDATWTTNKRAGVERAQAAIPRSRVVWMEGDHDIHVQHPRALAEVMLEALPWFEAARSCT